MDYRPRFHLFSHDFGIRDRLRNASMAYSSLESGLRVVVTNGLGLRISGVLLATHRSSSVTSNSER
jgi:hypothetical protein